MIIIEASYCHTSLQGSSKHPSAASDSSREDSGGPSVYEVELTKDSNGSLGISILGTHEGDRKRDEPLGGVYVNTVTPQVKGKLKSGDKILEVVLSHCISTC